MATKLIKNGFSVSAHAGTTVAANVIINGILLRISARRHRLCAVERQHILPTTLHGRSAMLVSRRFLESVSQRKDSGHRSVSCCCGYAAAATDIRRSRRLRGELCCSNVVPQVSHVNVKKCRFYSTASPTTRVCTDASSVDTNSSSSSNGVYLSAARRASTFALRSAEKPFVDFRSVRVTSDPTNEFLRSLPLTEDPRSAESVSSDSSKYNNLSTVRDVFTDQLNASAWKVTELPNGIRTASLDKGGFLSSVGVHVAAGCRFEDESTIGASQILESMAFHQPSCLAPHFDNVKHAETLGVVFQASSSREMLTYSVEGLRHLLPSTVPLLLGNVLCPSIENWDMGQSTWDRCLQAQENLVAQGLDASVVELLHQVAWGGATLGNPQFPETAADSFNPTALRKFVSQRFTPCHTVVLGLNVSHEELCRSVEAACLKADFKTPPSTSLTPTAASLSSNAAIAESGCPPPPSASTATNVADRSIADTPQLSWRLMWRHAVFSLVNFTKKTRTPPPPQHTHSTTPTPLRDLSPPRAVYVGGESRYPVDDDDNAPLLHLAMGLEVPGGCADVYSVITAGVAQSLLGGGGSFSAGGPGKGLTSRLYHGVLARYRWIENCNAFSLQYSDSGLFGIQTLGDFRFAGKMANVMCEEIRNLQEVKPDELLRAKNALKCSVLVNLENRHILMDDLARQLLAKRNAVTTSGGAAAAAINVDASNFDDMLMSSKSFSELIDKVSAEDIKRFAKRLLQSNPTVVAVGNTSHLPPYERICGLLDQRRSSNPLSGKLSGYTRSTDT